MITQESIWGECNVNKAQSVHSMGVDTYWDISYHCIIDRDLIQIRGGKSNPACPSGRGEYKVGEIGRG